MVTKFVSKLLPSFFELILCLCKGKDLPELKDTMMVVRDLV